MKYRKICTIKFTVQNKWIILPVNCYNRSSQYWPSVLILSYITSALLSTDDIQSWYWLL